MTGNHDVFMRSPHYRPMVATSASMPCEGICSILPIPACGEMLVTASYFGAQDNILFVKRVGSVAASRWCLRGSKRSPI